MKTIDDKEILNYYFDSREEFVVDFDTNKVQVCIELQDGTIRFILKRHKK